VGWYLLNEAQGNFTFYFATSVQYPSSLELSGLVIIILLLPEEKQIVKRWPA
jgi:hypothetical protein